MFNQKEDQSCQSYDRCGVSQVLFQQSVINRLTCYQFQNQDISICLEAILVISKTIRVLFWGL